MNQDKQSTRAEGSAGALLPRHLAADLTEALAAARVVNLIGPRQVGKTTLVRDLFDGGTFITLDDATALAAIEADPLGQLTALKREAGQGPLIIDEAQRSKALALAIKKIADEDRRMGQFLLTGSSNVFSALDVTDSLAGRMMTLKLWPLVIAEAQRKPPSRLLDWAFAGADLETLPGPMALERADYIDLILRGGYPEIRDLPRRIRARRYRDYVDAVVERDVADILRVRKTDALRRLINQLAARTAHELNVSSLASLIGVQRPTLEQYLDVLEKLSMTVRLGAWTSGEAKREIKNAKLHFTDTGIAAALRGLSEGSFLATADPAALGGLLESFVFGELLRAAPYQERDTRFWHWRDSTGREVDILAENAGRLVACKVKASTTVAPQDFKHLHWFAKDGPGGRRTAAKIVFYLGERPLSFGEGAVALPVSSLWAEKGRAV